MHTLLENIPDNSFDAPERMAHISRLMKRGYAVYSGELAVAGEQDEAEPANAYYALLVPLDDHQEQIHILNSVRGAAHALTQAQREIYWVDSEPFDRTDRFSKETVLNDPNVRTCDTAWGALFRATQAVEPEPTRPASRRFLPRERLRQERHHYHK